MRVFLYHIRMEILTFGNDVLRQKAASIENLKDDLALWGETVQKMLAALVKEKGIGLAGPQVGILQRIFVVNVEDDSPLVFINPSIIETSQETAKYEEGCLSIPGIWADVVRPSTVKVQAWNEKGRPFVLEAGGLLARIIQHEYDHLEGILFIDRLPELKRKRVIEKITKRASASS